MKEKKKTGEAGRTLISLPGRLKEMFRNIPALSEYDKELENNGTKAELVRALSAFNRRYRSRQREEKE